MRNSISSVPQRSQGFFSRVARRPRGAGVLRVLGFGAGPPVGTPRLERSTPQEVLEFREIRALCAVAVSDASLRTRDEPHRCAPADDFTGARSRATSRAPATRAHWRAHRRRITRAASRGWNVPDRRNCSNSEGFDQFVRSRGRDAWRRRPRPEPQARVGGAALTRPQAGGTFKTAETARMATNSSSLCGRGVGRSAANPRQALTGVRRPAARQRAAGRTSCRQSELHAE